MGNSPIPSNDVDYDGWLVNFVEVLATNAGVVGLLPADVDPLAAAQSAFDTALSDHNMKQMAGKAATAFKDTRRTEADALLRPMIQRINNHPGMSQQLRELLGLDRTDIVQAATPIEALTPLVSLDSGIGQVTVHWGPNPLNERSNGKPAGVKGGNVYRKKSGETDYQIVGFATTSPYYDVITGAGADYTYVVRYRGTKSTDLSQQSEANTIAARGELAA
jgi:hypothetical protein